MVVAKLVLRNLLGIAGYGLRDVSVDEVKLQRYTDSDWVECKRQKDRLGVLLQLGLVVISWISRKQAPVALSTVGVYCSQCVIFLL